MILLFLLGIRIFFDYMNGHPEATAVLFPCSLAMQGFKEATLGIIVLLFVSSFVCLFALLFV